MSTKSLQSILALSLTLGVCSGLLMPQAEAARTYRSSAAYYYSPSTTAANEYMQTGKFNQAEASYLAALKKNPNNLAARSALSVAQAELFKLDAAEKNARLVLSKNPKNPAAHLALGVVYRNRTASMDMFYKSSRDEFLAKSAAEMERAVELDPNLPEAHNQLGVTYRMQGKYADAQRAFNKALELDPEFAEALVNEGVMRAERGDLSGAKASYQKAMQRNSKNYMAHYRLGEAFISEGNFHEGLKHLNNALYLDKGNATIMSKQAEAYNAQGNTSAAVAYYRKAIQASPNYMPAYIGISNIFDSRGDGEAAMVELRSALNANPSYSHARNQLGRLALSVDKPDQSLQYYRESLRANPNDAEAIQGLSQSLMVVAQRSSMSSQALGQEGDLVQAEEAINEALQVNPNDMRLHLAALRIAQLSGKPADSQEELEKIVNQPTNNETQEMIKGEAYLSLGRYAEADQIFTGLRQKAGNDTGKLLAIGDTQKANGDLDSAQETYKSVLAIEPSNLKAQRGVQRIEAARGESNKDLRLAKSLNNFLQKGSSVDFYEDALSKNPRQPDARLALAKLYEKQREYTKAANSYKFYIGLVPQMEPKQRERYEKKIVKLQEMATKTAVNR